MLEAAGVEKLVNAALLSLINEACVNVCCATLHAGRPPQPLSTPPTVGAGRTSAVRADRAYR